MCKAHKVHSSSKNTTLLCTKLVVEMYYCLIPQAEILFESKGMGNF